MSQLQPKLSMRNNSNPKQTLLMSFIIRNVEHQDRPTVEVTLFRQMVMWKTLKAIWNMEEAGAQASNIQTKWSNLMSVWGFWA